MENTEFSLAELDGICIENIISRNHYMYNDRPVPRVTEIISQCLHEDFIVSWANRLGFKHKYYNMELDKAARYGTTIHEALEAYITTGTVPKGVPMNPINGFEKWWSDIKKTNTVKVLGQEFTLLCPYYGGTYDMLLEINGKPWLIDFKTSNHISFRYCLQLAAYRAMLRFRNIADVAGVVVLRLNKNRPTYEEFCIDLSYDNQRAFLDDCEKMFHSMVYTYWNRVRLEAQFGELRG